MPPLASIRTTSNPVSPAVPGASAAKIRSEIGGVQGGMFGALFREQANEAQSAAAGKGAEAKAGPQEQKTQGIIPGTKIATTASDQLNVRLADGNAANGTVDAGFVERTIRGEVSIGAASEDTRVRASDSADPIAGRAGSHGVMARQRAEIAKDINMTPMSGLQEKGQAPLDTATGDAAEGRNKACAAASASGEHEPRKKKGAAQVVAAGQSAINGAIGADRMVLGTLGAVGQTPVDAVLSATGSGRVDAAIWQGIRAAAGAEQARTPKLSPSTAQAGDTPAASILNLAANSRTSSADASSPGNPDLKESETLASALHTGRSIAGHDALDRVAAGGGLTQVQTTGLMSTPQSGHSGGREHTMLPPLVLASSAPNQGSTGSSSANATMPSPFDRIDQGSAPVVLHAGSQHVEVGVHDPQLGWVEISAQNTAGHINARLLAASNQTHSALAAQLPAIAQFLQQRDVRVGSLAVHPPAMQTGMGGSQSGSQSGSHAGADGGGAQHFQGDNAGRVGNAIPTARLSRSSQVSPSHATEGATLGSMSYISVRA